MEKVDLVVVGAGWYGLAAAKTYLDLNPTAKVVLFESDSTVGGVWSESRLYPGLKSNNMLGTYEYSDFPMDTKTYGVKPGEHIPGKVIHQYLTDYANTFLDSTIIRFNTRVQSAEHDENGGWVLSILKENEHTSQIFASKLIIATGLTSEPARPDIKGMDTFQAPLFHPKDCLKYEKLMSEAKSVCVLGGTKSAWDAVYSNASRGIKVDWVIRESGHGPTWMAPPYVTPLKKWLEKLVTTRLLTWFSPCIWGDQDGYASARSFLHGTRVGRFIVNNFWKIMGNDLIRLNKLDSHPELAKLKPWSNPMFIASAFAILNYDTDFFDLVKNGTVRVHIADIDRLSPYSVHLSTGETLKTDALIACMGWNHSPPLTFLPATLDLGLPQPASTISSHRKNLTQKIDKKILSQFPRLQDQPKPNPKAKPSPIVNSDETLTSFNLYRFMIPPTALSQQHRDIAFAGSLMIISTTVSAQLQALWISAYFSRSLQLTIPNNLEQIEYEAVLHNRFGKWRYPEGFGGRFPDFMFDGVPYLDMLCGDLGLKKWRKGNWLKEIMEPYGTADYKGLVGEYLAASRGGGKDL